MSKIVVCYYSENGESFYDAFCKKLADIGNQVYQWNIKNYIKSKGWGVSYILQPAGIAELTKIIEFDPDLVFSFNNAFPTNCCETLKCPICLLDADNPAYFWNDDYIKSHIDRFTFLGFKECSQTFYEEYLGHKIDKYLYFPAGTFVQKNASKKLDKNISFIGSYFLRTDYIYANIDLNKYIDVMIFIYDYLKNDYFIPCNDLLDKWQKLYPTGTISDTDFKLAFQVVHWQILPGQIRIKTLGSIADLGLVLYGLKEWIEVFIFDADLGKAFNKTPVLSLKDNEDIYNSSKISVNISHPQANQCFSWRVMDIMASNACLITEKKQDFINLFGQYLSADVLDAIIYTDKYDLRNKVQRLLADEKFRLRCVAECQNAIEQNGRWELRFQKLEKYLKVALFDKTKGQLFVERILAPSQEPSSNICYSNITKRLKTIEYCFELLISQLPLFSLCFSKSTQTKIYKKLIKYRRDI